MIAIPALLLVASLASSQDPGDVLTLEQALAEAASQPQVRLAEAAARAAQALADQSRAAILPQVSGDLGWTRSTANPSPTTGTGSILLASPSAANAWQADIGVSQLLYQGRSSWNAWVSAQDAARAADADIADSVIQVRLGVRMAFFAARAAREQRAVARQALANQERHLAQVEAFIQAGTRPEIDRAQARADMANCRVLLIEAENAWRIARQSLDLAIGRRSTGDYDVADEVFPPVEGEDAPLDALVARALAARPDVSAQRRLVESAEASLRSERGAYVPELAASASATATAAPIDRAALNWGGGLSLSVPIFGGGITAARSDQAHAGVDAARAQLDLIELELRQSVAVARANLQAARATVDATTDAVNAAGDRLRLAEGRYATGVGNAIELGDAQMAEIEAGLRQVQAHFDLAGARAELMAALGEE